MRTVVVGLGNPVRADDGVGLAVARLVRERLGDATNIDVTELGAGGLRLAEAVSGYDRAIVVDALECGGAPGTVRRLGLDDLGGCRTVACAHDTSLPTALAVWRTLGAEVPAEVTIFGIEVQDVDRFTEQLTDQVARAVPGAAEAVLHEICRLSEETPR
jgi:hydrogenase maturation protease